MATEIVAIKLMEEGKFEINEATSSQGIFINLFIVEIKEDDE